MVSHSGAYWKLFLRFYIGNHSIERPHHTAVLNPIIPAASNGLGEYMQMQMLDTIERWYVKPDPDLRRIPKKSIPQQRHLRAHFFQNRNMPALQKVYILYALLGAKLYMPLRAAKLMIMKCEHAFTLPDDFYLAIFGQFPVSDITEPTPWCAFLIITKRL